MVLELVVVFGELMAMAVASEGGIGRCCFPSRMSSIATVQKRGCGDPVAGEVPELLED